MSILTPTPVELLPFTVPADGEDVDAASVNVAFTALGNGVAFNGSAISTEVARATAVEAAIKACYLLADLQKTTGSDLGVSLANGGTTTQTVSLLSSGVALLAGDIVEVFLSSTAQWIKSATLTNTPAMAIKLQQNPNGGGLTDIAGADVRTWSPMVASKNFDVPFHVAGAFTVVTPGTLAISAVFTLSNSNAGDQSGCTIVPYTALYRVWRKL